VQKATELGAHRVVPLLTERVVTRLTHEREAAQKVEKWRQVAIESIKQCGSPWLPEIARPVPLSQFIARVEPAELSLVAALSGNRAQPRRHFANFQREHQRLPRSIQVWVGPEGDFTPDELAAIRATGAADHARLRAARETAAILPGGLGYELHSRPSISMTRPSSAVTTLGLKNSSLIFLCAEQTSEMQRPIGRRRGIHKHCGGDLVGGPRVFAQGQLSARVLAGPLAVVYRGRLVPPVRRQCWGSSRNT
jgi:hypothetical protein